MASRLMKTILSHRKFKRQKGKQELTHLPWKHATILRGPKPPEEHTVIHEKPLPRLWSDSSLSRHWAGRAC